MSDFYQKCRAEKRSIETIIKLCKWDGECSHQTPLLYYENRLKQYLPICGYNNGVKLKNDAIGQEKTEKTREYTEKSGISAKILQKAKKTKRF